MANGQKSIKCNMHLSYKYNNWITFTSQLDVILIKIIGRCTLISHIFLKVPFFFILLNSIK